MWKALLLMSFAFAQSLGRQLSAPLGFLFVLIFAKPSQKQEEGNEVMALFRRRDFFAQM